MSGRRTELLDALMMAVPQLVADGLTFHMVVADRLGLTLDDLRYLQFITEISPATLGEIAARTGLHTGAAGRMVDRLEQAGYLQRARDGIDRRQVVVVPDPGAVAGIGSMYKGMAAAWRDILSGYRDEELQLILDVFYRMREVSNAEARRLTTA